MSLDPLLMEILACPCPKHGELRQETMGGAPVLVCSECERAFPVRDDIPVMLLDEAVPFVADSGSAAPVGS